jgi:hypothetical protein
VVGGSTGERSRWRVVSWAQGRSPVPPLPPNRVLGKWQIRGAACRGLDAPEHPFVRPVISANDRLDALSWAPERVQGPAAAWAARPVASVSRLSDV